MTQWVFSLEFLTCENDKFIFAQSRIAKVSREVWEVNRRRKKITFAASGGKEDEEIWKSEIGKELNRKNREWFIYLARRRLERKRINVCVQYILIAAYVKILEWKINCQKKLKR